MNNSSQTSKHPSISIYSHRWILSHAQEKNSIHSLEIFRKWSWCGRWLLPRLLMKFIDIWKGQFLKLQNYTQMSFLNIVTKSAWRYIKWYDILTYHYVKVHYDKAEIIPRLQDWFHVFKKSVNGRLQLLFHIRGDWTLPRHPNCKLKVEHTEKSATHLRFIEKRDHRPNCSLNIGETSEYRES